MGGICVRIPKSTMGYVRLESSPQKVAISFSSCPLRYECFKFYAYFIFFQGIINILPINKLSSQSSVIHFKAFFISFSVLHPFLIFMFQIPKSRSEGSIQAYRIPQPELSDGVPHISLRLSRRKPCLDDMNSAEEAGGATLVFRLASFFIYVIQVPLSALIGSSKYLSVSTCIYQWDQQYGWMDDAWMGGGWVGG